MQIAKLLGTAERDNSYFSEYTVQRGDDEVRHLYSRVALGTNGRTRRFFTVTATCPESKNEASKRALQAAVASLQLRAKPVQPAEAEI